MTIIEFYKDGEYRYGCEQPGDMSGEYVPLAEYQALKTHMESLAKESYQLKGLIRRVIDIGPDLLDDTEVPYNPTFKSILEQLFKDCQEAIA